MNRGAILLGAAGLATLSWYVWLRPRKSRMTPEACLQAWRVLRSTDPLLMRCYTDEPPGWISEMCLSGEPNDETRESLLLRLREHCV